MDSAASNYTWDKAFFEKKLTLFGNLQMGFVGAALMLMMMDLSKIYLLAPLVVGLILVSWYKHNLDTIKDEIKGCSVTFAPKSILICFPESNNESRITFREIDDIEVHKENFIQVISLYLKNGEAKIELKAMKNADQLLQKLRHAIEHIDQKSE